MQNNNFRNISFNYYLNTSSYVKTILDILPEEKVSKKKKAIIIEIFNYLLNDLKEEELKDVIKVSDMFNEKLMISSNKEIMLQINYIYYNFLEKMIFDANNRKLYFNIMNECIKVYVDYYKDYTNDYVDNSINNMNIR